jgi:3-hydroxybutyryl-CoA dehydrogenase
MEIKRVGVVGCGTMGSGIAQTAAQAGYKVSVSENSPELLKKGIAGIEYWLQKSVEKGKLPQAEKLNILGRISGITKLEDFYDCDIVIEAVPDNLNLKKKIFAELDKTCPADTILATNTGSLSIIAIAEATNRTDKVLGLHFFNPAPVMKLLEVVKTIATSEETLAAGKRFGTSLGKTVVVAPDMPGFIVNRLMSPLSVGAIKMLEDGLATCEDIDNALKLGTGMPMGVLESSDLVGLDNILGGLETLYQQFKDPGFAPPLLLKKMVAEGKLGRKSGQGFYNYKDKNK